MLTHDHIKPGIITETDPHTFTTEASTLFGNILPMARALFPAKIETDLGNRQPLIATKRKVSSDGELQYVRYIQQFGVINLIVFND